MSLLTKNKELWIKAIGRGKAFLRNKTARKRESRNCDRWMLYELLRGIDLLTIAISSLENMDIKELRRCFRVAAINKAGWLFMINILQS